MSSDFYIGNLYRVNFVFASFNILKYRKILLFGERILLFFFLLCRCILVKKVKGLSKHWHKNWHKRKKNQLNVYVFLCVSRALVISDSEWLLYLLIYLLSLYKKKKKKRQGVRNIKMEANHELISYALLLLHCHVSEFDTTFTKCVLVHS